MTSLKHKIFILFVLLLLTIQSFFFWTTYTSNQNKEQLTIDGQLSKAQALFDGEVSRRDFYLQGFAKTVANDYGLKNAFDDDARSLALALHNHGTRIEADISMILDTSGQIVIQLVREPQAEGKSKVTKGPQQGQAFSYIHQLKNEQLPTFYWVGDALYQLHLSPLKNGPSSTMGWVGFGFRFGSDLAQNFKELTGLNIDFALQQQSGWSLLGSSAEDSTIEIVQSRVDNDATSDVILITEEFETSGGGKLLVVMHSSRDDLLAVLQARWLQLLVFTALTLVLSLAAAYVIAATITRPIALLVEQAKNLAAGNYHQSVSVEDKSELGQLAAEFNAMQEAVLTREKTISHRVYHDPLTDLPNRNMLKLSLKQLTDIKGAAFTVFHLNLCRLKDVNDTLGHDAGDKLIIEAGKRLLPLTGDNLLCHLGADEFILLCPKSTRDDVPQVVEHIVLALQEPCEYQDLNLKLQVRVGVAFYPEHSTEPQTLLQKADTALHQCREAREVFQIYDPATDVNTVERLSLINDLEKAINENQLALHYQPKLNLSIDKITHVEALVRWHHPELGMIAPDEFIHIAEQTGQINSLTRWVFIEAMTQYLAWKVAGFDINMAINVSAENLKDAEFYDFVCQTLDNKHVPCSSFTLEVTESAVVDDPESAIALLSRFKQRGFHLSIDDYGTGYSSLAQLKQLPVHELKIDKSFVLKLADNEDDGIIVKSTIELAHNMGLTVVAEGIEDEYSLDWLKDAGCDLAQGYFISRPKPAVELYDLLVQKSVHVA